MTIVPSRRQFLKAGGALVIVAAAPSAFGQTRAPPRRDRRLPPARKQSRP